MKVFFWGFRNYNLVEMLDNVKEERNIEVIEDIFLGWF